MPRAELAAEEVGPEPSRDCPICPRLVAYRETNRAAQEAGLRALRVPARRAINSNAARRGAVEEFLITNVEEESKD